MLWTPLCEVLGWKDGIEAPSYELDSHVVTGLGRDLSMHMLGPKTMASARRTAHTRFPQGARPLMAAATIREDSIPSSDRCNRSSKMFIFPRDLPNLGEKQEKKKEENSGLNYLQLRLIFTGLGAEIRPKQLNIM